MIKKFAKDFGKNFSFEKHRFLIVNFLIVLFFLTLPYLLFRGKLFLGGDDSRLFYAYPKEYLINTQFFSWSNLSSVGWNYPYHDFLPFVLMWSLLSLIFTSPIFLDYLAFSLTFILGFIYFQKMMEELVFDKKHTYNLEILLGSIFYISSPILIQNHFLNPLIPIWLIGLIPAVLTYFLRYLKTNKLSNILLAVILTTIFSFGFHNIPWIAGFLLPVLVSIFVCSFLFNIKDKLSFVKKFIVFIGINLLSQSFWLVPSLVTFLGPGSSSVTSKVVSAGFGNDFARAIRATSDGVIIQPLLNLYHRQIAFDFNWYLKDIFLSFYDKTYILCSFYLFIIFLGIFNFKKNLNNLEKKIYLILLTAFILSLYFFTINIGPLLDLFIFIGKIPGFILFRNPYDKFALGYSLIYASLITYSLIVIKRKFKKGKLYKVLFSILFIVLLINALPTKDIILSPLWTTKNIYKNITFPSEYLNFMSQIKTNISPTNDILSIPYGLSLYTVVKDTNSNNVYVGVSPVVIFSGVNDISGYLSFNYLPEADEMNKAIVNKNYSKVNKILYDHNINYVMLTKNIPTEVRKSFIYVQDVLAAQDKNFIENITTKRMLISSAGNYELYTTKKQNNIISSNNLQFFRANRIKYEMYIKNIRSKQQVVFIDSYHPGWKLYLNLANHKFECQQKKGVDKSQNNECNTQPSIFKFDDLLYLFKRPVFISSHSVFNNFSNRWIIDPQFIKSNFDGKYYKEKSDGSIDLKLTLYFEPQEYFYIGIAISLFVFAILTVIILKQNEKNN